MDLGIERIRVVDQGKLGNRRRIHLPIGDGLAVGTPLKGIPESQFFFVNPIRRAVDNIVRIRTGQGANAVIQQVLEEDVSFPHESYMLSRRRDLGEHHRGCRCVASQLAELSAASVQQPIVASRVVPPDALGIGKHQQQVQILGPGVVLHLERRRLTGWSQFAGGDHDGRGAVGRVAHHVLTVAAGGCVLQRGESLLRTRRTREPARATERA